MLLSHGGGGRRTEELIKRIFAKYLGNPILNQMDDAAVL
ncbi:MAG: hydrogenase expression/formation protein HypE, partial [Candidatus Hydrothermota bacterium]